MNKKEWIRTLKASMQYYADFYGAKEEEITELYKKEIEQYADLMVHTKSSEERLGVMNLFTKAAKSWAVEEDERLNRKYIFNADNMIKSESVKNHLKSTTNRVKGFLFNDMVDMESMFQYAKGCNLYNTVLTKNARRLQADLIR